MTRFGRLPGGRPFDAVFRDGGSVQGPFFVLRHRAGSSEGPRVGFAVGKRIDKRATVRNTVRRRLRAALEGIELDNGDYVIVARARAVGAEFGALQREAARLAGRIARPGSQ